MVSETLSKQLKTLQWLSKILLNIVDCEHLRIMWKGEILFVQVFGPNPTEEQRICNKIQKSMFKDGNPPFDSEIELWAGDYCWDDGFNIQHILRLIS